MYIEMSSKSTNEDWNNKKRKATSCAYIRGTKAVEKIIQKTKATIKIRVMKMNMKASICLKAQFG
jgi:hypothetical protein